MEHTIETAVSNRSKCRGCGNVIEKGSLRLGERLPNPFSDATPLTLWFHPECAAYKRPETFMEAIELYDGEISELARLRTIAEFGAQHKRVPRITGAERASSGRASCRQCRETIAKDEWRIKLVYFEDGRFNPSGYLHPSCSTEYFETTDILDRIKFFSPELSDEDTLAISDLLA